MATKLNKDIDPLDTIQRIAIAWIALDIKCNCGPSSACDICEITHLIDEALVVINED